MRDERIVIDASALLDLLVSRDLGLRVLERIGGCSLHAPGHIDAEVFSGLGRLEQAGLLCADDVSNHAGTIAAAPIARHAVAELLAGAWSRRHANAGLSFSGALYVELARTLGATLVTTDSAIARAAPMAELVGRPDAEAALTP